MNFKILLRKSDENDATHEYINIIKSAVTRFSGIEDIPRIHSAKEIKKEDILIIISLPVFIVYRLLFRPRQKFIYWFQGVTPEEIEFLYTGLYAKCKSILFPLIEKYVLKKAELIFFVSEKQLHHYQMKYGYKKDNYFIMPCFNKNIDESCFAASKYEKPTFVYAGSMLKWQCIEETLRLFSEIKRKLPEAQLTLLTAEQKEARMLLAKYNVSAEVKYVPLKQLSDELAKYKYGFLLRDKILINEVATPTKMNSYMAAGVIPVFSDVIGDFSKIFRPLKYVVVCNNSKPDQTVENILEIEKNNIAPEKIIDEYRSVFDCYYNTDRYVCEISKQLKRLNTPKA